MLKRLRKIIMLPILIGLLLVSNVSTLEVHAAKALDKIWDYTINITPYSDGSLSIEYHIEWEVLDSVSEGPLTWVKIGIPNNHVEEITALSDNIEKIQYYQQGGDYVKIDLDKAYRKGAVIELDFSIHQHRMYEMDGSDRVYTFTPGWFDDIHVENLCINWDMTDVSAAYGDYYEYDGYYCWMSELSKGEKYTVEVVYPDNVFSGPDNSNVNAGDVNDIILLLVLVIAPALVVLFVFISKKAGTKDSYSKHSGMGYVYAPSATRHRSGGGRGCACACACACAGAGGGRAGCSKKDFYGTKLTTLRIRKALSDVRTSKENS